MDIAAICRKDVVTIDENASYHEAASLMRSQHVGALVVTAGVEPRVTGIVTDRDLAIEVLSRKLDIGTSRIGQIASRNLAAVPADGTIGEAVAIMQRAGVRRLLVIEEGGHLTGLVSSDDLFEALAGQLGQLAGALRAGIAREGTERRATAPASPRPIFQPHGTAGWQA